MKYILFYPEPNAFIPTNRDHILKLLHHFGVTPIVIDPGYPQGPGKNFWSFKTLKEAKADPILSNCRWYFLHCEYLTLDTMSITDPAAHIQSSAVYAVGHNDKGFGMSPSELRRLGWLVSIPTPTEQKSFWAAHVIGMLPLWITYGPKEVGG